MNPASLTCRQFLHISDLRAESTHSYGKPQIGIQRVVDVPYATKGIRLKLFDQASMRSGRMETAWDGYIEGGDHVAEQREPVLLRTLLEYFGKDFVGRAKLVQ